MKRQLILLSLAGACLLAAACRKSGPPPAGQRPPPAVTISRPVVREIIEWDEYPGRLEAMQMVEVRARVSGYLQAIHFKDGAEVKKGDLLFEIDPRPYQADVNREEANVKQMLTRLELASNDWVRAERLLKTKAISEEEADARSKASRETMATLQMARAALDMAKLNVEYARITAPIDGRIGRKMMTEGNLVQGSQGMSTLLATIVSLDPIYCYFDVDELAALKFQKLAREGLQGNLRDGKMPCELELGNETGFPHHGVLDFVDNQIDPSTGTLRLRGLFPNLAPDRPLQPGFFARVRVPASPKHQALLIPDQAVGTDQEKKFVLVVNVDDTVEYRPAKLGPMIDGLRVIREGVGSNDWVVVNGGMTLRDGMKVIPTKTDVTSPPVQPVAAKNP